MYKKIFEFIALSFLRKLTLINSFFTSRRWLCLHLLWLLLLIGAREGIVWIIGGTLGLILLLLLLLLEPVEGGTSQDHSSLPSQRCRLGGFLQEVESASPFF